MQVLSVLVERATRSLDRPFAYAYEGKRKVGERCRVKCSFGPKTLIGFVIHVREYDGSLEELQNELGFEVKLISEEDIVDEEPLLSEGLFGLAKEVASYYMAPLVSVLQAMLPPSLSPRSSSLRAPKVAYDYYVEAIDSKEDGLTPKQIEMLRLLLRGTLRKKEAGSPSVLKALIEKKKARLVKKERMRFEIPEREKEVPHEMTFEQKCAYEGIVSCPKEVVLLQGVTGSGKTEVYLRLSEHCLSIGRKVLMLVPEINLTPAMVDYFSRRFGKRIAILHSELTPGERYDEYRRIARGEADIVVGARSAVFAPISNLGLIILDEEHVESYKQDNAPHYHAREVAIMRGRREGAKVVLGSATPSLETRSRAMRGVYGYFEMPHRVNERPLPRTEIVDLRAPGTMGKESSKLSRPLIAKIRDKLEKGEQVLLLINRRGYWTGVNCPKCGHLFKCPECGGNLVYHFQDRLLKCHHCGHVELFPDRCPECGNPALRRVGYGTERLEEETKALFPTARVARLDSDVARSAARLEKLVRAFKNREFDILIGTQMVAKGHDFPYLSLAAVALADIGLALPGYRSAERTFELIAQAVGRAGRALIPGEALIQTYNPTHYAIVDGARQDYLSFYEKEMKERKLSRFPPYVYLIAVELSGEDENRLYECALAFADLLRSKELSATRVIGPIIPYMAKREGLFRRSILIKFKKREDVEGSLRDAIKRYQAVPGLRIDVDVDPLDF